MHFPAAPLGSLESPPLQQVRLQLSCTEVPLTDSDEPMIHWTCVYMGGNLCRTVDVP